MAVSKRALQATLHAIIHIANSQKYSNTLSILIDGRAEVLFCQHSFSKYFQFGNKQIIRTHFPQGKSGSDHIGLVPPRDWWQQHVTGMLHSDGLDPGQRHQKKPARWAGFCFLLSMLTGIDLHFCPLGKNYCVAAVQPAASSMPPACCIQVGSIPGGTKRSQPIGLASFDFFSLY